MSIMKTKSLYTVEGEFRTFGNPAECRT